jgi:uncharacterized protein YjbI with pentapeptide repeats
MESIPEPRLADPSIRRQMEELIAQLKEGKLEVTIKKRVVEFSGEDLQDTDFAQQYPNRDLCYGVFVDCNLQYASLERFNLSHSKFTGSNLAVANLSEANVENSEFFHADCKFVKSELASFYGANLTEIDLSGADLRGVDFTGCDLSGAKLVAVRCEGANFSEAILRNCDFRGSDLRNTEFSRAQLFKADFSYANMVDCHFHPVDFSNSNFYQTEWNGDVPLDWPKNTPNEGEDACMRSISRIKELRNHPNRLRKALASGDLKLQIV